MRWIFLTFFLPVLAFAGPTPTFTPTDVPKATATFNPTPSATPALTKIAPVTPVPTPTSAGTDRSLTKYWLGRGVVISITVTGCPIPYNPKQNYQGVVTEWHPNGLCAVTIQDGTNSQYGCNANSVTEAP